MAIDNRQFELLARYCRGSGDSTVLVAGYPDMLVYPEQLTQAFGHSDFEADPRSGWLKNAHGHTGLNYMRKAEGVFAALGYSQFYFNDIQSEPGMWREPNVRIDLNLPGPPRLMKYDLVQDHGTLEHCFNVGQALIHLAGAAVEGGQIYLHLPLNISNHGYYNFSPVLFADFFDLELNGFEIELLQIWDDEGKYSSFNIESASEFIPARRKQYIDIIARRRRVQRLRFPSQQRYRSAQ